MRFPARTFCAAIAVVAGLAVAVSPPAMATSDEDQVRTVLDNMNSSYNGKDFSAFATHICSDMLQTPAFAVGWYQSRTSDGPTRIIVNSVKVMGGDAVANVRFVAANQEATKTLDVEFVREDAEWKACKYDAGRTV